MPPVQNETHVTDMCSCVIQESNEALLAYFFLWQGQLTPLPMEKSDLDRAVEDYLNSSLHQHGLDKSSVVDFDVSRVR